MSVKWGVLLPTFDPLGSGTPPVLAAARRAEDLGFGAAWVGDHLVAYPPVLDAFCCLSAAAAVTSRAELGISVLQLGLRQPAWAAKQLATIEALAPGRLRLGVGVGGEYPAEFAAAGVEHGSRGRRLDEMLAVLPALLSGEPVEHAGPLAPVRVPGGLRPAVSAPVPLAVGGRSDAALRRAARYGDQWLAMWLSPATITDCAARLAAYAAGYGRPTPSITLLILVNIDDDVRAARAGAEALIGAQYRMPLAKVDRWTACGAPGRVAELLSAYVAAGVTEFVLMPASAAPLEQYERMAAVRDLVPDTQE